VAVIDSGISGWHIDLLGSNGQMRVKGWKDFVNGRTSPYDDLGHGTHVAGIIGGNGLSSLGLHAGVAPAGEPGGPQGARLRRGSASSAT
jgi:serine protease AprX